MAKQFELWYYQARYLDFGSGRFISQDLIGFTAGDTNLYRYVGNSPTNATDPTGRQGIEVRNPITELIGFGLGALGAAGIGILTGIDQVRADPDFSDRNDRPPLFRGRLITSLANQLRSCEVSPDQIPLDVFTYNGRLVSASTRTLAALSLANLRPSNTRKITPDRSLLSRFDDRPIGGFPKLPSPILPITPSRTNLTVIYYIRIPDPA